MSCTTFGEFVYMAVGLIGVTRRGLAELIGVHQSTINRWIKDESLIIGSRSIHLVDDFINMDHSSIVNRCYQRHGRRIPINVSDEDWRTIQEHYQDWKRHYNAELGDSQLRFQSIGLMVKLLRWRDGNSSPPFETKIVGMSENKLATEIYDEAVLYYYGTIETPIKSRVSIDLMTSGTMEVDTVLPARKRIKIDSGRYDKISGAKIMRLTFDLNRDDRKIFFKQRVFNGFQRRNESINLTPFGDSTAGTAWIAADFEDVIERTLFWKEEPHAYCVKSTTRTEAIPIQRSHDSRVWYTSHDDLDLGSRIGMNWSLSPG